jgi:cytochrome c peroxidase
VQILLNLDPLFDFQLRDENSSTHSRKGDEFAIGLKQKVERIFVMGSLQPGAEFPKRGPDRTWLATTTTGASTHPYRFTFSSQFPIPDLPRDNPLTEEGVELGRRLFNDKRLSINNEQSCASCHVEANALTDPRRFSRGAEGQVGTRNAMPIFNLAWKKNFFWDGRASSLRDQVLQPIQNPIEMHEKLDQVVAKLESTGGAASLDTNQVDYPQEFQKVFGTPIVSVERIAKALEQFAFSKLSYDSKFDRAFDGKIELTPEEKRGFELFITEYDPRREQFGADCFHCHGGPLFQSQSFANNGLDAQPSDLGRYDVTKLDGDKGRFAVPSLRNIELTAPYMHDGRFKTLEEVVEHYSTGTKRSATLDPNLAKHPDGGVPLTAADKKALVAFLKTLTDERFKAEKSSVAQK